MTTVSIWTILPEFTEHVYQNRIKEAIALAERFLNYIVSHKHQIPERSHASEIDFFILSTGKLLSQNIEYWSEPICRCYLNVLELLSTKPAEESSEYRIVNDMQGIFKLLCSILEQKKSDKDIVYQWCRIVNQLRNSHVLTPHDSPIYFEISLNTVVTLLYKEQQPELYYDHTYFEKQDFRTEVLELIHFYNTTNDYDYFFAKCNSVEREIHIASVKSAHTPQLNIKLAQTIEKIYSESLEDTGIRCASLHALFRILCSRRDNEGINGRKILHYYYLAVQSDVIKVKYTGLMNFRIVSRANHEHEYRQEEIKDIIRQLASDICILVRTDSKDLFRTLMNMIYSSFTGPHVDEDEREGLTLYHNIAKQLKGCNADNTFMSIFFEEFCVIYSEYPSQLHELDFKFHPLIDYALQVVHERIHSQLSTDTTAEEFLAIAIPQAYRSNQFLNTEQVQWIKELIGKDNAISLHFYHRMLRVFIQANRLSDIVPVLDVRDYCEKAYEILKYGAYDTKDIDLYIATALSFPAVFQYCVVPHQELRAYFKDTWLEKILVIIETEVQQSIDNAEYFDKEYKGLVEFFVRLCGVYNDEKILEVFASVGAEAILSYYNHGDVDDEEEYLAAFDLLLHRSVYTIGLKSVRFVGYFERKRNVQVQKRCKLLYKIKCTL